MKKRRLSAIAAAIVSLMACTSQPAGILNEPVILFTGAIPMSGTTSPASQQRIVATPDGSLVVTYERETNGVSQLFVATSRDRGDSWLEYPQISSGPTRSTNPHLVVDPRGGLFVFWTKGVEVTDVQRAEIEGERTGVVGAGDVEVSGEAIRAAEIEFGKESEEEEHTNSVRQIFFSRFDGASWHGQEMLTTGEYNGVPSAAFDSKGILHLVWYGFDGRFYQIVYSNLDGQSWSQPGVISLGFPDSLNPAIAVDSRDNLHVVWYKYSPATKSYQVNHRMYSADQQAWSDQRQISGGLVTALNASLAVAGDDTLYVAYDGDPTLTGGSAVYLRAFRDGEWRPPIRLTDEAVVAERPSVAVDSSGVVYVMSASRVDGQLYLWTSLTSTARRITSDAVNLFPNTLRQDARSAPSADRARGVEFVWTSSPAEETEGQELKLLLFGSAQSR